MRKKMKVLFILQSALHVRNFISSGFSKELMDAADVTFVIPKRYAHVLADDVHKKSAQIKYIEDYVPNKLRAKWLELARAASVIQRRHLNNTYGNKVKAYMQVKTYRLSTNPMRVSKLLRNICLRLLGAILDLESIMIAIDRHLKAHSNASKLVGDIAPDVVFSATVIHETGDYEIAKAAKEQGKRLINFVASWDNLTSKGFFLVRPDTLLVWGDKDKTYAMTQHGFKENQIVVTGTPQFDQYFDKVIPLSRDKFLKARGIDIDKNIVMFAGTTFSKYANEPRALKEISRVFLNRGLDNVLFWYRPHPRSMQALNSEYFKDCPNIYLDDQIVSAQGSSDIRGFEVAIGDLTHYLNLINACEGAISIFSTMVVEFALLKKPSILINFQVDSDGKDIMESSSSHAANEHLKPLYGWNGITVANSLKDLADCIENKLLRDNSDYGDELQRNASEIACNIDGKAKDRILKALLVE